MSDETTVLPDEGNGGDVNVNVPDTTGGQQVPDTIPEPVPVPFETIESSLSSTSTLSSAGTSTSYFTYIGTILSGK